MTIGIILLNVFVIIHGWKIPFSSSFWRDRRSFEWFEHCSAGSHCKGCFKGTFCGNFLYGAFQAMEVPQWMVFTSWNIRFFFGWLRASFVLGDLHIIQKMAGWIRSSSSQFGWEFSQWHLSPTTWIERRGNMTRSHWKWLFPSIHWLITSTYRNIYIYIYTYIVLYIFI